jgi:predicted HTH transcriptional regulator
LSKRIKKLIDKGENQQLDFKFEIADSKKIARTLAAFANKDGGTLLVGVKDNGVIAGVRSDEEYYMVEAAATMYCKPEIDFSTSEWNIDGKIVLEVKVPKSAKRPHYASAKDDQWKIFIRVNDQNLLANKILLSVWKRQQKKSGVLIRYRDKEKLLLDYLKSNPFITFSRFCRIAEISKYKAETILVNFILLGIIEIIFTEKQTYYKLSKNYK